MYCKCTIGQKNKKPKIKQKKTTPIYFNKTYLREMKLVPIIMDYCELQFDALIFFLRGPST